MTTFNWLTLFGVPAIVFAAISWAYAQFKETKKENDAIKLGVQALLLDRLQELYRECKRRGSASNSDRQNFENMYKQYHNLGANGVMDDTHTKFLSLPIGDDE